MIDKIKNKACGLTWVAMNSRSPRFQVLRLVENKRTIINDNIFILAQRVVAK